MNFRAVAVVVFLVVVSGGLAVHFRQQSLTDAKHSGAVPADAPVPSKNGPHPKFTVVGETVHNFGIMEFLQKGEHEFKIRNDGQAPLQMVALARDQTCSCTLGSLGQEGLKPGEETTVKLSWTIKMPVTLFEHSAKIRTNDPKNLVTTFRVRGLVGKRLLVKPSNELNVGVLSEKEPTERTLFLYSEVVDKFEITKYEPSNPLIKVTAQPMNAEQLHNLMHDPNEAPTRALTEQLSPEVVKAAASGEHKDHAGPPHEPGMDDLASKKPEAKSGYELKIMFESGFPIGKLRERLGIFTDIPSGPQPDAEIGTQILVTFTGNRSGPVQILGGTPGTLWAPEESMLRLGRFSAKEGKKARLIVFVKKFDQELEISEAKLNPPFLKYEIHKNKNFNGTGRDQYELTLEVPGGNVPLSIGGGARNGSIVLETNHPDAKTIKIDLEFTSH